MDLARADDLYRWCTDALFAATDVAGGASPRTASQDGLPKGGVRASEAMAETDMGRLLGILPHVKDAARLTGIPGAILAAIASRESRCGGALAADGTGDHGNAFGVLQVDRRYHQQQGFDQGPSSVPHLVQGAKILARFLLEVIDKHPAWAPQHQLKGAIVAYNSGVSNVRSIARMDRGTTGDDYGADVLARALFYATRIPGLRPRLEPSPDAPGLRTYQALRDTSLTKEPGQARFQGGWAVQVCKGARVRVRPTGKDSVGPGLRGRTVRWIEIKDEAEGISTWWISGQDWADVTGFRPELSPVPPKGEVQPSAATEEG